MRGEFLPERHSLCFSATLPFVAYSYDTQAGRDVENHPQREPVRSKLI